VYTAEKRQGRVYTAEKMQGRMYTAEIKAWKDVYS